MDLTVANARQRLNELVIPESPVFRGRGIVICAGGRKYGTNAYALVRLLRDQGCTLPIQVWSLEHEQDDTFKGIIEPYGVTCINAAEVQRVHPHDHLFGWELKSYAIKWCSFEEVLLIDSDMFPVSDPSVFFESVQYQETGAIFLPDVRRMGKEHQFFKVFGLEAVEEWEFESGAIFIDKKRHWKEVCLADFINQYGVRFFWREAGMLGDKDSWRAAFRVSGSPYSMTAHDVHHLDGSGIRVLVQHDFDGNHFWFHRNLAKFSLSHNDKLPGFVNEEQLLGFVEDLKALWVDQRMVSISSGSSDWLVGKVFAYSRVGYDSRRIVFGPHSSIIEGMAGREAFYYFADDKINVLGDDGELTFSCSRTVDAKVWVGRWLQHEKMVVVLEEV